MDEIKREHKKDMRERGYTGAWIAVLALALVSALLGWARLSGLPDLGVTIGPDLTIRQVAVERSPASEAQNFQRGDRLVAVEGMTLEDLRHLRALLPAMTEGASSVASEGGESKVLNYQILRPLHRFSVTVQGEGFDPTQLPPGVEPTDRLVEIDGRILPGKVGPEGLRSVVASRSDALLGLERPNAIFSGQMRVGEARVHTGLLLTFGLALIAVLLLWWRSSEVLPPRSAYLIALETVGLAWLYLMAYGYQWLLADEVLAALVIVSLVMMRPMAMYARRQVEAPGALRSGASVLAIGAVVSLVLVTALYAGYLANVEVALHAAAILAGLFVIYEISAQGFESGVNIGLGERYGYLTGVVVLGLFACVVAAVMEPVAFEEDRWRWFAVLIPSMVWFGDYLFALKYGVRSALGDIADERSRQELLYGYLREVGVEVPGSELRLVGRLPGQSFELRFEGDGELQVVPARPEVADAVDILLAEGYQVPMDEAGEAHPMVGIAEAMALALAQRLPAPRGCLELDGGAEMVVLGSWTTSPPEGIAYAAPQALDVATAAWSAPLWSAAMIELLEAAAEERRQELEGDQGPDLAALQQEIDAGEEERRELSASVAAREQELSQARRERDQAQADTELFRITAAAEVWPESLAAQLVEPELVEGLRFLLETPEPIAIGGAIGVGKSMVGALVHALGGGEPEAMRVLTAGEAGATEAIDLILGEEAGGQGPGLLQSAIWAGGQGTLLVRRAQLLDEARMVALCHQCEEAGVRLCLAFDAADAEERSVLEGFSAVMEDALGHREVIVPAFRRRGGIQRVVLEFWLQEWSARYGKEVEGFSRTALDALLAYSYPGEVREAVEVVRLSVLWARYDVIDREDLPTRVREARPL
ncbi:hypothetical protein DL240_06610 [Lujinxingia litoralis]|uniref:Sigma-54 factor interaction domain-containing protein n=1 Tax=Lujinxingia litoralis TaxID=2211119 RepID=A0A328C8C3_9DELT|nr:hypothetical protein [Lujinxingia litoralis]RAL23820.1 hypothetical protein DL240_06610 [Lujinxingia litoralis]